MKFKLNQSAGKSLAIPLAARQLSGLNGNRAVEIHALDGAMVVAKYEMSAMDIVNLIASLNGLSTSLGELLVAACGPCDGCGACDIFDGTEPISLPAYVLEQAGLPQCCKLTASASGEGRITVSEAGYDYDLTDVPPGLLETLRDAGICVHELDEKLISDEIVYSGKRENASL